MMKQSSQPRKKKSATNTMKKIQSPLSDKPPNFLFKFTEMMLSPKASTTLKFKKTTKAIKSSNATPSNKSRKTSKENLFQTAFCSKKTSEVSTPF